jgi:Ca2+-binding EF-hand superfamily protein
MKLKYTVVPLLIAAAATMSANADDDDKRMRNTEVTFRSLDKNSDDRLSRGEVSASQQLVQQFSRLDADSDGYVTKQEYAAQGQDTTKTPSN